MSGELPQHQYQMCSNDGTSARITFTDGMTSLLEMSLNNGERGFAVGLRLVLLAKVEIDNSEAGCRLNTREREMSGLE